MRSMQVLLVLIIYSLYILQSCPFDNNCLNILELKQSWTYIFHWRSHSQQNSFLLHKLCLRVRWRFRIQFTLTVLIANAHPSQMHTYRAFHKLTQIYTANHTTFPIRMYAITVQICGNFWSTKLVLDRCYIDLLNLIWVSVTWNPCIKNACNTLVI